MKHTRNANDAITRNKQVSLLELLDRILDKGVVIKGEILLSVASIDLVYLNLGLFLSSVKTVVKTAEVAARRDEANSATLAFWQTSLPEAVLEIPQQIVEESPGMLVEEMGEVSQQIVGEIPGMLFETSVDTPLVMTGNVEGLVERTLEVSQQGVEKKPERLVEGTLEVPPHPVEETSTMPIPTGLDTLMSVVREDENEEALERALSAGIDEDRSAGPKAEIDPENVEKGLTKLVLTLVDLVRKLMEKQAIQRIEAGQVNENEIERVADTFFLLDQKMEELKEAFGLQNEELNLDLGPLGELI